MKDPRRRPSDLHAVLRHPFFHESSERSAPRLRDTERHHCFLSHFQGNAGPRCMTIKFLIEGAVPNARVWFDQVSPSSAASLQQLQPKHQRGVATLGCKAQECALLSLFHHRRP